MTLPLDSDENSMDSDALALGAPHIPVLVSQIGGNEGYQGGIGTLALNADLLISIDPWLDNAIGQSCQLFWGDDVTPVLTETLDTPEKLTAPLLFHVQASQILDGSAFPVFYRVIRSSGNEADSFKLKILIKRTLPGGLLDKPEPPSHPHLLYSFTPDIKEGVDSELAKHGIFIRIEPYLNITPFDRIVARWGDEEKVMFYPVTPEQISEPKNHPILIRFDEQLIKRAGDGKQSIIFQVIDRCGNRPHAYAPWAIPTEVIVNTKRIPAPLVTGEQGGVLDPAYNSNIEVFASGVGPSAGDSVRVHWQGRIERQTTAKTYSGSGALEFLMGQQGS